LGHPVCEGGRGKSENRCVSWIIDAR